MTQEQYDKCSAWEKELRWAVRSSFVHMTNADFAKLAAIYKEVYGEGLTPSQMTCNTCRLRALQRLGGDYFSLQQEKAVEEAEIRKEIEAKGGVVQPEKRKTGRKKKIEIN